MDTCHATTHGRHVWEEFMIPSHTHDADGIVTVTPTRFVQECLACGEQSTAVGTSS